jgi:hypothetical protein
VSPSGNLANTIKDIFGKQSQTLNTFSNLIGTLADASGAVSTITSVVGLFTNMGADPLQPILDVLQRDFQQLQAEQKAENIIMRRTNQVNALAPVAAIVADLNNLINAQPPPTEFDRLTIIEKCNTALLQLGPDPLWDAPYNDQVFWNDFFLVMWPNFLGHDVDLGYGEQAPTADSTGAVFNYFYILPAYMQAAFMFITVAAALFPSDFGQRFADNLKAAAELLQARHDKILSGITQLYPGPFDRQMLMNDLDALANREARQTGITAIVNPPPPLTPLTPENLGGANIEYGAVEKFSGFSSMGSYQIITEQVEAMDGDAAFNKFQLRLLKRTKDVYIGVGLLDVWKTINNLKRIVGDAPLPMPNFADWSVRKILSTARIRPRGDGLFHLSDLVKFIRQTVPHDTDPAETSFSRLLS